MALSGLAFLGWSGALALTTLHCWVGPQERPYAIAAALDADSVVPGMRRAAENASSQRTLPQPNARNPEWRLAQVLPPGVTWPPPLGPPPDPPGGLPPSPQPAPPIDPPVPMGQPAPPPDPPIVVLPPVGAPPPDAPLSRTRR
ncbi:MAG: hypothetical protein WAM17_08055 [Rhodoplanes sp.]